MVGKQETENALDDFRITRFFEPDASHLPPRHHSRVASEKALAPAGQYRRTHADLLFRIAWGRYIGTRLRTRVES